MRPSVLAVIALIPFVFCGSIRADPAFPEPIGAGPAWPDGPSGVFRPYAGAIAGVTWVVDGALGQDTNAGSDAAPFATIARALEAVSPGDTVLVRPGVYHEQIAPPDLGSPTSRANPVLILADSPGGQPVVLDGTGVVPVTEGNLDAPAGISLYRDSSYIVEGFEIRNWVGYGLAVVNSSDVIVVGCRFQDNGTDMAFAADLLLLGSRDARVWSNTLDSATELGLLDKGNDSWIAYNAFSGHTESALKIGPTPAGLGSRVEHNTFLDNPAVQGVILARDVQGVTVQRNLLVRGNLIGLAIDGALDSRFVLNTLVGFHAGAQLRDLTGCRVEGNILADNTMGIEFLSLYLPASTVDYNVYFENTADVEAGQAGANAVFGDPGFVDPAADEYQLSAGGAAVDVGPPDLPVPVGGGERVDAGADELGATDNGFASGYHYQNAGAVADTTPAFTWSYVDGDPAGVQGAYRVQLDPQPWFDSPELIDSNWQMDAESAFIVPKAFALAAGIWYARVQTRDEHNLASPWSPPQLAFEVSAAPACAAQGGTACQPLAGCEGTWLPAGDQERCCLGACVACADEDLDGYADAACGGPDCDDTNAGVHPGADESCDNGLDDDCDDATDLGDSDCGCVDFDQDGYGVNCPDGPDCDDTIASVHPGAEELCNYVDDNCDGQTDEGVDLQTDPDNCGECFWACRSAEVCDLGNCAAACGGGRTNCDRACIDTSTDLANCGGCGQPCDLPNASERCVDGQCSLSLCEAGFVDADQDPTNGCEYACTIVGAGVEECDNGLDDDCDGFIDEDCSGDGGGGCGCATSGPGSGLALFGLWLAFAWARRTRRRSDRAGSD